MPPGLRSDPVTSSSSDSEAAAVCSSRCCARPASPTRSSSSTARRYAAVSPRARPILYGDATRREILEHATGIENAKVVVFALSDPVATRYGVRLAHELNPSVEIIVHNTLGPGDR